MNERNRILFSATFCLLTSMLTIYTLTQLPPDVPISIRYILTAIACVSILGAVLMGTWGLFREKWRRQEIAAVRSVYPALADIPHDTFKQHYLFIRYVERTPDPLPVRLNFTEADILDMDEKRKAELRAFDRLLAAYQEMDAEQKRMCRMRFILECLYNLAPKETGVHWTNVDLHDDEIDTREV